MKEQGRTDARHVVKLPSAILSSQWLASSVTAGGEVGLEARTQFVADGSPVKIRVFRASGKQWAEFDGKVYGDIHRRRLSVPLDMDEDLLFQADLSEHGIALNSPLLPVLPALRVAETKWLDEKGNDCVRVQDGEVVQGKARLEGAVHDGDLVNVRILTTGGGQDMLLAREMCVLQGGWVSLSFEMRYEERSEAISAWPERNRQGTAYAQPALVLEASCRGALARGKGLPIHQQMLLCYADATGGSSSEAGRYEGKKVRVVAPDGTEKEYSIPSDGKVTVDASLPGRYLVEDPILEEE